MINNSSRGKWDRLAHKQLDQQFVHEVIDGLQCSPFEASGVLDTVHQVYGPYFESSGALKLGQMRLCVLSAEAGPNRRVSESKQVTVTLTFDAGQEDMDIRQRKGVAGLRRHRMERMAVEAFQQGGLLTLEDLAHRLLNCGQRTLSRDLGVLRRQGVTLPLRSAIKDMGRSISHRTVIVEQWLQGREYSEIARATHHSIASVQNYVGKFKRVAALSREGYDIHTIAFLVKLSPALVKAYHELHLLTPMVPHRQRELSSFLKKGLRPIARRNAP